jgi:hypothetical protein
MRVVKYRNASGFPSVQVSGDASHWVRLAKQRRVVGRLVGFAANPRARRPSRGEHALPRNCQIRGCVDELVMAEIKAEAERRGQCWTGLISELMEYICDDKLFEAILGPRK